MNASQCDLIVLAADLDMEVTARALLENPTKLDIRNLQFHIHRHPEHDPGCHTKAATYLRNYIDTYRHALVIFDRDGCGSTAPRDQIQQKVEQDLHRNGWADSAKAIVIEPELETWIWTSSPITATTLGCDSLTDLQSLLERHDLCRPGNPKPPDPKKAMRFVCRQNRVKPSSTLFGNIASKATSSRCQDPSFVDFRKTLQDWFPSRKLCL